MTVLDSAAAIRSATHAIGTDDGMGACLANVYRWFGSVQSTGPGSGHFSAAINGWEYATQRNTNMASAPAGVPVYFGVDTPRTDRNADKGDVGLSIGGGRGIFTDSPTGRPGVMTFTARAAQVRRNMLGWTGDFLGHDTTAGQAAISQTAPAVAVPTSGGENDMILFEHAKRGQALGGAGYFHPLSPEEAPWAGAISSAHIVCINERHFDLIKTMCTSGTTPLGGDQIAKAVWGYGIKAENGSQPAGARLAGADLGRNLAQPVLDKIAALFARK